MAEGELQPVRGGQAPVSRTRIAIKIACPKGLGDTIYLRAVALHLLDRREAVKVFTRWPDVFHDLPVRFLPLDELHRHPNVRQVAYTHLIPHDDPDASQFRARCEAADIYEPVELQLRWTPSNRKLLDDIRGRAGSRKILIYQPLKVARTADMELMRPRRDAYRKFLVERSDCFRVRIGHPPFVDDDRGLPFDFDLFGRGFIRDTFDVCTIGDLFFGECCFVTVIAEALDRNIVCMFARRALASRSLARNLTLNWQFHKRHLATIIFDD